MLRIILFTSLLPVYNIKVNKDPSGHNQHRKLKTGSDSYIISNNFCNSSNQNFTPQIKGIFSKAILK